jgi:hypothetical protein
MIRQTATGHVPRRNAVAATTFLAERSVAMSAAAAGERRGADLHDAARLAARWLWPSARWRHVRAAAGWAAELAGAGAVDPSERELLVAAAWLHDIGYAPGLAVTRFHPLDGANHLAAAGWPPRLAALVAHHSGARFRAAALGLDGPLAAYPYEDGPVADALTYADQTTGPHGERLTVRERRLEWATRHPADGPNGHLRHLRERYIRHAAARVDQRLAAMGRVTAADPAAPRQR